MKKFLLKSILFFISCLFMSCVTAQGSKKHYPEFSWKTVPVAFHFGKKSGLLTEQEAQFVTAHSNFICLEKGHARDQLKTTEEGIPAEAAQLKKLNPKMKVIFYWNTILDYPLYTAHNVYESHPEWWLKTLNGELDIKAGSNKLKRYDLSKPEVRNWWTDVAKNAVTKGGCDGIFMDAFPQVTSKANVKLWGQEKYDAIQKGLLSIIKETREKIGQDKIIIYNGIRSTALQSIGNDFPEHTDAVMIEHFDFEKSKDKESMLKDILEMSKAGKSGKIVAFKAWPGFSWLDTEFMKQPYTEKRAMAVKNITFPLAAFLVGAQENAYFLYNWGYNMEMGCLDWYPELDMPLGKPLGDAKIDGWKLSREFEHLSVHVNLETKECSLSPKK